MHKPTVALNGPPLNLLKSHLDAADSDSADRTRSLSTSRLLSCPGPGGRFGREFPGWASVGAVSLHAISAST